MVSEWTGILCKNASNTLKLSDDSEVYGANMFWDLKKAIAFPKGLCGSIRVSFDMRTTAAISVGGRVYIDGYAVGTERSPGLSYTTYTEDFTKITHYSVAVQVYAIKYSSSYGYYIRNFRIYYDDMA